MSIRSNGPGVKPRPPGVAHHPATGQLARLLRRVDALAGSIRGFVAGHPQAGRGRCRCELCRWVRRQGVGWPGLWDELAAIAATLRCMWHLTENDRPRSAAETRRTVARLGELLN